MSDVSYEKKLHGAWLAIQEIKAEPDAKFWDLFDGIWLELRDGLEEGDDENVALETLVAFAVQAGHSAGDGWV